MMAAFSAYYDAAGTQHDSPVLVSVGVLSSVEKWSRFDRQWLAVLRRYDVQHFHMKDMAHWQGDFAAWNKDEQRRIDFTKELIQVAARCVNKVVVRAIVVGDYNEADRKYGLTKLLGGAYSYAQSAGVKFMLDWLLDRKSRSPHTDKFGIFIEQGDAGQDAFRKFCKERIKWEPVIVPRIDSNTGEDITPLSLSDMIAYEHRLLYSRALARRSLSHPTKWRGALRELRRILPVEAGIIDRKTIDAATAALGLPTDR